jgi:hypothetical protein
MARWTVSFQGWGEKELEQDVRAGWRGLVRDGSVRSLYRELL